MRPPISSSSASPATTRSASPGRLPPRWRIAESQGVRMPSFFGFIGWGAVCLLPWLLLIEAIFFR